MSCKDCEYRGVDSHNCPVCCCVGELPDDCWKTIRPLTPYIGLDGKPVMKSISRLGGDPQGGKIDMILGWLRVAKTRPVSYERSNQYQTALALMVKPLKTSLALLVSRMTSWMTMFSRLAVSGGGLPPTPLALSVKSRGTYLLGAYVLAG